MKNKGVRIQKYVHPGKPALSSVEMQTLFQIQPPIIFPSSDISILWQASWHFRNRSGYMKSISKRDYPEQSKVTFQ